MVKWKKERLAKLKVETKRLLARINEAEKDVSYYSNRSFAAVKRASLDLNREAVKTRKGYYNQ